MEQLIQRRETKRLSLEETPWKGAPSRGNDDEEVTEMSKFGARLLWWRIPGTYSPTPVRT